MNDQFLLGVVAGFVIGLASCLLYVVEAYKRKLSPNVIIDMSPFGTRHLRMFRALADIIRTDDKPPDESLYMAKKIARSALSEDV